MAESPLSLITFQVTSNGTPIPEHIQLLSARVSRAVNATPSAELEFGDPTYEGETWAVSDGRWFVPGTALTIGAGGGASDIYPRKIFEGLVVKIGVRCDADGQRRLVVSCLDKTAKMTLAPRFAAYADKTEKAVMEQLAAHHSIKIVVEGGELKHEELVQFGCTDWDYLNARAAANGLLVIAHDGQLSVKPPRTQGDPCLKVDLGEDDLWFEADLDAGSQLAKVEAAAWDSAIQSLVQSAPAAPASLSAQGNISSSTLAKAVGPDRFHLPTAAPHAREALDALAKARQVRAGLARIRGAMRLKGNHDAKLGELVEIRGAGDRFDGLALITGIEHVIKRGEWTTEVRFGLPPEAPRTASGAAGIGGLQVGVVARIDDDPAGAFRVLVEMPLLGPAAPPIWARLAQPQASTGAGFYCMPEVGDEVVLGYFNNDPSHPVVLGGLYSRSRPAPYSPDPENDVKALVSRRRMKLEMREAEGAITLSTPQGAKVELNDRDNEITLEDSSNNRLTLNPTGIALQSSRDVTISAAGAVKIAATSLEFNAQSDIAFKGFNVRCTADAEFKVRAGGKANLNANTLIELNAPIVKTQ